MDLTTEVYNYRDIVSGHPHFNAAYRNLRRAIRHAPIGNLIFLYGPTGVGKSTLLKHSMREILIESAEETSANPSILPIVRIELDYSDSHKFSWIEFYRSGLKALQEPLVDKKLKNVPTRLKLDLLTNNLETRAPGHALKAAFISALSKRNVKVLLLDEAHHMAKGFEGGKLVGQLEYLKSLANKNNIIIVLAGTYDLISFRNLSGQLSRRSIDVHFPRYRTEIKEDNVKFRKIIKAFSGQSPLVWDAEILNNVLYLYTYSVGCVGILKNWIDKAHLAALDNKAETLSLEHFKSAELSIVQLKKITDELVAGEKSLKPQENDLELIQVLLGINAQFTPENETAGTELMSAKPTAIVKAKRKQVGIRNAKRDLIGKRENEIS
ncbi:MAG: AAA family ATPase [Desulfuromonadaceae bacterium]|nr:AAA family ATPase [Desulfuromonadaceae bacterium]MDD2848491.1 AAA family ATPase [Desulfuromonadaceae bacterium]MDD4129880.1 AAA family ATPase [Desulfuromonadaceae bacterium]